MSWAEQREQIRRTAQAGSGQGLALRFLTRPNSALTRAGQFFYQLAGRQPPSRTVTTTSRSWVRPSSRRSTPGWPICRCGSANAATTAGGYERLDYLPVTSLNVGLQRQNDGLSEGQVARNIKQAVLQKLAPHLGLRQQLHLRAAQDTAHAVQRQKWRSTR